MSERSRNSQGTRRAKTGETLTGLTLVYIVGIVCKCNYFVYVV